MELIPPNQAVHPVVDRYVTTDTSLQKILESSGGDDPVLHALLMLQQCINGTRLAKNAIAAAQALSLDQIDPSLRLLLLSSWAELCVRIGNLSSAEMLIRQTNAQSSDSIHPEILANCLLAESLLADTKGDKGRREELLTKILGLLPSHSPRRKFYLWELTLFLAIQGRGIDGQSEIREMAWNHHDRFSLIRVRVVQVINAIETGDLKQAAQLMPEITASPNVRSEIPGVPLAGYNELLSLMIAAEKNLPNPPPLRDAAESPWVSIPRLLLQGKPEEALDTARVQANRLGTILGSGFEAYNLIRAELSTRKWENAARLLRMRGSRGNRHYMDDFFLARAEHLSGNRRAAAQHFAALLKSVQHYQARGRMEFELSMARELSNAEVVELSRSAEKLQHTASTFKTGQIQNSGAAMPPPAAPPITNKATALHSLIGRSDIMAGIRSDLMKFTDLDTPVLITGETGTGKDLVARALHDAGKRRTLPFLTVNCGAITDTLLESELFGHERGAFTGADRANRGLFEAAAGGTIFLDEIGHISPRLQGALLVVLETGEIRAVGSTSTRKIACRVLAATNLDLAAEAEAGRFRQDLVYRLQRLSIAIPPLRERRQDIPLLIRHYLDVGRAVGIHATVSDRFRQATQSYDWPGNVRELRNVIERMRLLHSDKLSYDVQDLDARFHSSRLQGNETRTGQAASSPPMEAAGPLRLTPPKAPALQTAGIPHPTPQKMEALGHPGRVAPSPASDPDEWLKHGTSGLRRRERILDLFEKYQRLTRHEVIRILGVAPNTATKYLKTLCEEGLITRKEPSASSRSFYFEVVNSAAPKRKAPEVPSE